MAKKVPFEIDFFNTEIGNSVYTSGLPYLSAIFGGQAARGQRMTTNLKSEI